MAPQCNATPPPVQGKQMVEVLNACNVKGACVGVSFTQQS